MKNREAEGRFRELVASTTDGWVREHQPAAWLPDTWTEKWRANPGLPYAETIAAIEKEYLSHDPHSIPREFIFTRKADGLLPVFIAAMAWGYGDNGYGAWRTSEMLKDSAKTSGVLTGVETKLLASGHGAVAAGLDSMFTKRGRPLIPWCNVAFATKFLHFAGYQSGVSPRPLIYDLYVARALARIPDAPFVPHSTERIAGIRYQAYCERAEQEATADETTPIVVEYALWQAGKHVGG